MKLSPEYQAIWEKVQENKKRLESCPGPHEFKPVDASSPATRIGRQACTVCGGEVDAVNAIWYRHGLEDANKAGKQIGNVVFGDMAGGDIIKAGKAEGRQG